MFHGLLFVFVFILVLAHGSLSEKTLQDTSRRVIVPEIINGSNHIHPWLATCVSLIFLAFIVALIVIYGG